MGKAVQNMVRTLAYVWSNRLIFYQALRARFSSLPHSKAEIVSEDCQRCCSHIQ